MSATPLISRLKELGSIVGWLDKRVAFDVTEAELSALVAEQVALAVAEYKKDAKRYRWLRLRDISFEDKYGMEFVSFFSPSDVKLDTRVDEAMSSTEQTKGA